MALLERRTAAAPTTNEANRHSYEVGCVALTGKASARRAALPAFCAEIERKMRAFAVRRALTTVAGVKRIIALPMDGNERSDKEVSGMKTHTRVILIVACVLGVGALAVPSAALADGKGATKQQLLANTGGDCSQGATSGTPIGHSFVILNKAGGKVSAQIHLQGAPAGGRWGIELNQSPLEGCNPTFGGFITTNNQGNGNAHVSEPILPGNTGAFVRLVPLNDAAAPDGIIASVGVTF